MAIQADIGIAQVGDEIQPVAVGKLQIDHGERRTSATDETPRVLHRRGLQWLVAVGSEVVGEKPSGEQMILDQEDRRRCAGSHAHQSPEP
jgi:hypothetical protein